MMRPHQVLEDTPSESSVKQLSQRLLTPIGVVQPAWEEEAPITLNGYLPFFSEFLIAGDLFSAWQADCPLEYTSNNAPKVKDVLGTAALSVLSGHSRFCHSASLYGDDVSAGFMGIDRIVSHDSLSRALGKMDETAAESWLQKHLLRTVMPLLQQPYVLDMDPTVKPLYGHQEGAAKGYNPTKPGRPSLCYHTYFIANLRLLLAADVRPGNQNAGCYSHPRLWQLLEQLPHAQRPAYIRGDIAFGNQATMAGCEQRDVRYLFKLRQSPKVQSLLKTLAKPGTEWVDCIDGWSCVDTELRLTGWSRSRRVVVFRRPKHTTPTEPVVLPETTSQPMLHPALLTDESPEYESFVLVTDLSYEPLALAQAYRDRGDCENCLDELKNQWGWGGFTSRELKRTRIMAGIIGTVYNWWNIFCRLAKPDTHMEAKTSRPKLQQIVGRLVTTGRQKLMRLYTTGQSAQWARECLTEIADFITALLTATQLTPEQRWARVLTRAFSHFLGGASLFPTQNGPQFLLPL